MRDVGDTNRHKAKELMDTASIQMPYARTEALLVHELLDEVLVYDLRRHRAHCLNRTAALVWRHCDGQTTVADVARILQDECSVSTHAAVVWYALAHLERAHLLREPIPWPSGAARYSRRELARTLGIVGGLSVLLPLVEAIVAPVAAQTLTCILDGQCAALPKTNCGGAVCCSNRTKVCRRVGTSCTCP